MEGITKHITKIVKLDLINWILKSILRDYSDTYIPVNWTITIAPAPSPPTNPNINNKEVIFKNCLPLTDSMSEINNAQTENATGVDVIIPMYNIIK